MNAKTEFLNHIGNIKVLCVRIRVNKCEYFLTTGYTKEEWNKFLTDIDLEYDSGYGGQELYGTIWFTNGFWSTRGEYDGSEWWYYHEVPEIPEDLNRIDKVRDSKLNDMGI